MLGSLARNVDEHVGVDVGSLCDSEIRERYLETRREIDRLEAFAAGLLVAAHGRGIPAGDGGSSTPAWVQWQTGQRFREARESLDTGKACETLPLTAKAWAQGEISASAARTIAQGRRAGHEDVYAAMEDDLVAFASVRDFPALDALIRRYQARCDALDDKQPEDDNGLYLSPVGNRWALKGNLDALAGSLCDAALSSAIDPPSEGDARSAAQRRVDAWSRICRFWLDRAHLPDEDGERPHLFFAMNVETLLRGEFETDGDLALSPAQIGRLLCDAKITPIIIGADGNPLDVGATIYRPSRRLRRAVIHRDRRRCRYPGCDRRHGEVHHVITFPGGQTVLANLVFLCDYHHHLLHKPGWHATFDGTTFTVTNNHRLLGST